MQLSSFSPALYVPQTKVAAPINRESLAQIPTLRIGSSPRNAVADFLQVLVRESQARNGQPFYDFLLQQQTLLNGTLTRFSFSNTPEGSPKTPAQQRQDVLLLAQVLYGLEDLARKAVSVQDVPANVRALEGIEDLVARYSPKRTVFSEQEIEADLQRLAGFLTEAATKKLPKVKKEQLYFALYNINHPLRNVIDTKFKRNTTYRPIHLSEVLEPFKRGDRPAWKPSWLA